MRKIHVTRQFFGPSIRHGDLFEKTKNPFLDKVCICMRVCVPNFRSVSFFVWPGGVTEIHKYIHALGISSTGGSPHVDFDKRAKLAPNLLSLN